MLILDVGLTREEKEVLKDVTGYIATSTIDHLDVSHVLRVLREKGMSGTDLFERISSETQA